MNGIWKYSHLLSSFKDTAKLTLGEGSTPLVKSRQLGPMLGLKNLYFKLELINPSGSYKDRFAAAAVSDLLQKEINFCIATSSGNTGAALAAYCAAARIKCYLAIVDGAPMGKVQQMQVYGAETLMIKDFGIDPEVTKHIMNGLRIISKNLGASVQISAYRFCPLAMSGVQTISYEIAEEISAFSGHIFSPAGGGGLTLAITKGFHKWKEINPDFKIPKVHCVQPKGNNTISGSLRNGLFKTQAVAQSLTSISGLQVPNIIDGDEVLVACRATGGTGYVVDDHLIYECQENMANTEGIFCEPAGAVGFAGLLSALKNGEINKKDHIVCMVTGHGFKDPISAEKIANKSGAHYFNNAKDTFGYIESQIKTSKIDKKPVK
jgi:threonine synthase